MERNLSFMAEKMSDLYWSKKNKIKIFGKVILEKSELFIVTVFLGRYFIKKKVNILTKLTKCN